MTLFARKTRRAETKHDPRARGLLVSTLLRGVWREAPDSFESAPDLTEVDLTEITPLLCHSGAGALAWRKIRDTPLGRTAAGRELQEVYRRFRLSALLHEREIVYVLSLLHAEGIDAVLVKGWAIARRYLDPALRPYGDIDLCVAPAQFAKSAEILKRVESIGGPFVDLHCGFGEVGRSRRQGQEDDWEELFARSHVVMLNGQPVRILSDEDHLRVLCLHLLRSGARRPTWLCDVAMLVEEAQGPKSRVQNPHGSDFAWDVCLGGNPVHAHWIASAIGLAHQLLGTNIENTPFARKAQDPKSKVQSQTQLPAWLVPAVLRQWGTTRVQSPMSKVQSNFTAHRLWTLDLEPWTDLYRRWDNPIRATAAVGGQFNNWPRLPYRLTESIMRLGELPSHFRVQRSAVRGQRTEVRKSEVRDQRSEVNDPRR